MSEAKSYTCNQFSLSSIIVLMIGFCPGGWSLVRQCWPHFHYAELAKQLIDEGYQVVLFGSAKIMKRAMRFLPL
ncbi:glycosyltransferase family 9 protein [Shigella flexneri]